MCLIFERTIYTNEQFVLVSQAKQVFYVQNSNEEIWHTIVEIQTRGVYNITLHSQHDVHESVKYDLINWDRNDIVGETIYTNVLLSP